MSDDDSGSTIELNRRRILAGLGTIGVASAGAGAGTMALFSDSESSTDNTVQAGTLELSLGGSGSDSTAVSASDLKPGDSNTAAIDVTNGGSLDGYLDVSIGGVGASGGSGADSYTQNEFVSVGGSGRKGNWVDISDATTTTGSVTTTIKKTSGGGTLTVEVDAPFDINICNLQFDTDGDGFVDLNVIYQPSAPEDSNGDGWVYKTPDASSGLAVSKQDLDKDDPEVSPLQSANESGGTVTVDLDASSIAIGEGAAIGGNVKPAGTDLVGRDVDGDGSKEYFGNYSVPLVPGGSSYGPKFNSWGGGLVPIDTDGGRNIDDLVDISVYVSSDASLDSSDPLVSDDTETLNNSNAPVAAATGKPSRLEREFDVSEPIPSGSTKHLIIEYEVPPSTGNAIQGETLEFDLGVDLDQKDSQ